jgi:hypothetical protein
MFNRAPKLFYLLQSRVNISRARKSGLATGKGESGSGLWACSDIADCYVEGYDHTVDLLIGVVRAMIKQWKC